MKDMKILSSAIAIYFPTVKEQLRFRLINIEEEIKDVFLPFNVYPIPENAPYSIPRAGATTQNGHSNLNISAMSAQLFINFDGNYCNNLLKCLEYTNSKVCKVFSALEHHLTCEFLYSGLTVQLEFDQQDPTNYIERLFLKNTQDSLHLADIDLRFTKTKSEKYYINVDISNKHELKQGFVLSDEPIPMFELQTGVEKIGVCIDVNDRYGYNHTSGYRSNKQTVTEIINILKQLLEGNIQKLITEGRFCDV